MLLWIASCVINDYFTIFLRLFVAAREQVQFKYCSGSSVLTVAPVMQRWAHVLASGSMQTNRSAAYNCIESPLMPVVNK